MYLLHICIIRVRHWDFNLNRVHILCNMMLIPVMRNYFIHNCALFSLLYPDGAALYTTVSLLTDRNNRPLHGYKKRTLTMVPSKTVIRILSYSFSICCLIFCSGLKPSHPSHQWKT